MALAMAALAFGCHKKNARRDDAEPAKEGPEGASASTTAAPERAGTTPEPASRAPLDPPRDDEPTQKPAPVPISEGGSSLYTAASDEATPVVWEIQGARITFSTTEVGRTDSAVDVQVTMESGGRRQLVTTCRGLDVAGGSGAAAVYQRGAGSAYVTCTTGVGGEQRSWGTKLRFDEKTGLVEPAGGFEMQGPPAIDTIDDEETE